MKVYHHSMLKLNNYKSIKLIVIPQLLISFNPKHGMMLVKVLY